METACDKTKEYCCVNHPHRRAKYTCMKFNVHLCEECAKCQDPMGYCKFRSQCMIYELYKQEKRQSREEKDREKEVETGKR